MTKRANFLPFARPDVDDSELNQIKETLESGWITTGPKTRQFEQAFATTVGAKYAVAVNSGTAAMHLALEATGLQPGDIVLTTPYTFAATAEVIRYFNATPVFIDVEPDTLNIDPDLLAEAVHDLSHNRSAVQRWLPPALKNPKSKIRNPKSILPVHLAGLPAELDKIYTVAAEHNLSVIEDAAHAFPTKYKDRFIGATAAGDRWPALVPSTSSKQALPNGAAVCFSFYATKAITTGEGGMLTTDNEAIAKRCRTMALHGISKDAWNRQDSEGAWYYEIIAPGYKYNFTDIAAAMGLAQLAKSDRMWQRRREIAGCYNEAFGDIPELQLPHDRSDCRHSWHLYMLRLNLDRLNISRSQFIKELKARNIGASVHFIPLHLHPYYRDTYGYQPEDFPVAYREYQREISLPIYSKMSDADVQGVIEAVLNVVVNYKNTG